MKKVVLITGANGMLAKYMGEQLSPIYSVRYLTRNVSNENEYLWDLKNKHIDSKGLIGVNYIIHLAGSSIVEKRWSKKRKQTILASRVDSGLLILEELKKYQITIDAFISASAIGYYGTMTSNTIFNEGSPQGNDFLSDVCSKWENTAQLFKSENVASRVSVVRCGIILSKSGGALKPLVKTIKYGIGSGIGKGTQYIPWIHIQDLCGIFKFIIKNEHISGIFNAVSPEHITNIELVKQIAKKLKRKIILPNIPSFFIKGLLGERAILLLEGSRVSSYRIIEYGFKFEYENLEKALTNIFR